MNGLGGLCTVPLLNGAIVLQTRVATEIQVPLSDLVQERAAILVSNTLPVVMARVRHSFPRAARMNFVAGPNGRDSHSGT